jgi:nucleoside-diphosphate-sugar epimerase
MIDVAYVTGSSGKIGNALVAHLLKKNILVIGIGRFSKDSTIAIKIFGNRESNYNIDKSIVLNKWARLEENNLINLFETEKGKKIQSYFFHLAWEGASSLTDGSYEKQIYNVGLSAKYLDLSKKLNVIKFINSGSIDEIYLERCMQSKNFKKIENFQHLEYGIAKLATRDILSFKSYVENIDFIHTQTSIAISNNLINENFVERNLKNIFAGKDYELPKNKELCNISTVENIAEKLYSIALVGSNQQTYYTGTDESYNIENYFKIIKKIKNGKPVNLNSDNIIANQILTYEDFKNTDPVVKNNLSESGTGLSNLLNSLQGI